MATKVKKKGGSGGFASARQRRWFFASLKSGTLKVKKRGGLKSAFARLKSKMNMNKLLNKKAGQIDDAFNDMSGKRWHGRRAPGSVHDKQFPSMSERGQSIRDSVNKYGSMSSKQKWAMAFDARKTAIIGQQAYGDDFAKRNGMRRSKASGGMKLKVKRKGSFN